MFGVTVKIQSADNKLIQVRNNLRCLSFKSYMVIKARFKRRTFHVPNLMQMRKIYCCRSFALDSAHVKFDVWNGPKSLCLALSCASQAAQAHNARSYIFLLVRKLSTKRDMSVAYHYDRLWLRETWLSPCSKCCVTTVWIIKLWMGTQRFYW